MPRREVMLHPRQERPETSRFALVVLLLAGLSLGGWVVLTVQDTHILYNEASAINSATPAVVVSVDIGDRTVHVPSWEFFRSGALWSLVTTSRPLNQDFVPSLEPITVATSSEGDMRLRPETNRALTQLFAAAQDSDVELMVSSAYRSAADQQAVYDQYLSTRGRAYVNAYVAKPGTSEHQSGYAVDIASASKECTADSDICTLAPNGIAWLEQHAPQYGFIQRYPAGKQSITGVAGEAWHYRYVGTTLARALSDNGFTLDEFVKQIAPGYAGRRE